MTRFSLMRSIKRFGGLLLLLGLLMNASAVHADAHGRRPSDQNRFRSRQDHDQARPSPAIRHGRGHDHGLSRGRPGDASGRQTRRQNQIRARSRERPVRRHKNREGAMRSQLRPRPLRRFRGRGYVARLPDLVARWLLLNAVECGSVRRQPRLQHGPRAGEHFRRPLLGRLQSQKRASAGTAAVQREEKIRRGHDST